ncbi:GNAT family N-acetyltransferase [Bacteroidota bacterium]
MNLIIKPLSAKLVNDYLTFFDNMVFSENPDWSKCYCYSYHFTGTSEQWNKESNRSAVVELIKEDKMRGYLAFDDDKVVGWCNVNDKKNYQALPVKHDSRSNIASIVCFIVSPLYRRKGIAQQILKQVCTDYTLKGYESIEAYPKIGSHSCENNYHGHVSLYEKFDFQIEKELDKQYLVRKIL